VVLEKDGEDYLTDSVRNEEVLHGNKKESNIVHTINRKADCPDQILLEEPLSKTRY
jgi:hypothetical protein